MNEQLRGVEFLRKGGMVRLATFSLDEVLPYVFTRDVRHKLSENGYTSDAWINASRKTYPVVIDGRTVEVVVPMGSQRYQLFVEKGCKCVACGIEGKYFALERHLSGSPYKYHFNLYGKDHTGREVMLTKDHIVPRSRGGRNRLDNYQVLCSPCNTNKADMMPC